MILFSCEQILFGKEEIPLKKKKIKRGRMWKYFTDATVEIIEKEGMDQVTIRKVADIAGYNSATIYNYFTDLSHLLFFASMRLLGNYTRDVVTYMEKGNNALEKYLLSWECFCEHSFKNPDVFYAVFIMDLGDQPDELIKEYYDLYPADLIDIPESLRPILFHRDMSVRGRSLLQTAYEEGMLKEENINHINEMTNLLWHGVFTNYRNNRITYTYREAIDTTMMYISQIIKHANTFDFTEN